MSGETKTTDKEIAARGEVWVSEDYTLEEAVKNVDKDARLTTIIVGAGTHQIAGDFLMISSAMNIVGDPSVPLAEIVIKGGIRIKEGIQGNCHLQHLALCEAKRSGIKGESSFTMEDVLVEQSKYDGVVAKGTGVVGRCTNVEVCQCGGSGVYALLGASITLIGKTTVYNNCTNLGSSYGFSYGLKVSDVSTIQMVSLTKEIVSFNNGGGRKDRKCDWGVSGGAIDQIKTITTAEFTAVLEQQAAVQVPEDCKTLKEAVERVHGDDSLTTILVGEGVHQVDGNYLEISSAMRIVGRPGVPKEKIVVVGGIQFNKGIGMCHLQHLTLRQAKGSGVFGSSSFTMEDVLVEQCKYQGVFVNGTVVGRCTNVEVRQCELSGMLAYRGASITLIGAKTTVHNNCTKGDSDRYGLHVGGNSTIQLVYPLTKEGVSVGNVGGGDYGAGGDADINQIKTITTAEFTAVLEQQATVRVPGDWSTLKEAVERVHKDARLTTIIVGRGEHQIDGDFLQISSAMNIVGDPGVSRAKIVINGGIFFNKGIGMCHLQHLTLRQAKYSGVFGESSFTMEDVVVEQCGYSGVFASGTVVGRFTNVEVRNCGTSGVCAFNGASITLIGEKTSVDKNSAKRGRGDYGLQVSGASSTIYLVYPLTKKVSDDNGGGRNWGATGGANIDNIRTAVRVPEDCKTLKEAVHTVNIAYEVSQSTLIRCDESITTIIVGKGEHKPDGYLVIRSAMRIVGDPGVSRDEIVIKGGIGINKGIGMCDLQHLTLRGDGVIARSSFRMEDVLVEHCVGYGVGASGLGVYGFLDNVEVYKCELSGVFADVGASITLMGPKTKVHLNCTKDLMSEYGLKVSRSSLSTIQLVAPLTKEVSYDNVGGGNLGAEGGAEGIRATTDQIKTITIKQLAVLEQQAAKGESKEESKEESKGGSKVKSKGNNKLRFF